MTPLQPGMVYITFPTEYGTLYSAKELDDIYQVCKKYNLPLFVDGARLGYALGSSQNDITLPYLSKHCDVFYIGGTKVGALCGEAVVFTHNNVDRHFLTLIKEHGGLLAKSKLIGIQFDTLFTDDLMLKICKHAIDMAEKLKEVFKQHNIKFYIESPTNQQFVILSHEQIEKLSKDVVLNKWEKFDDNNQIVRFVTCWCTTEQEINRLNELLDQ